MAKIKYNKQQIEELKSNKYVEDCTEKYITFTDEFKIKVLKLDAKWIYCRQIFFDCWFPEYIWNSNLVPRIVWNWKFKFRKNWWEWIIWTKKWRKKKENKDISKMTLEQQNEYLKAEVKYLKELHKKAHWHYP